MQLKLALRWYQADHGKPAENLDELVPKYLSSIPLDPYDGKPFHYRLLAAKRLCGRLSLMPIDRCASHKEDSAGSGPLVECKRKSCFHCSVAAQSKMKASGGVYPRRFKPGINPAARPD